ncbi:MAG TPA: hypothetical protein VF155_07110 [Candidatus Dormibacteraeota bacterium]
MKRLKRSNRSAGPLTTKFAARAVGSLVGAAGLTLMGAGTLGSPTGVFADNGGGTQTITAITEQCAGAVTGGVLSVSNAVAGDIAVLEVYAHKPGSSVFEPTGATTIVTMVSGQSDYNYTISGVPSQFQDGTVTGDTGDAADPDAAGDDYNTWRVQVLSVTGIFDGTTTKTVSYDCTGSTTTTTTTTDATTTSQTSSHTTTSTDSSTSSTTTSSTSSSSSSHSTTSSSTSQTTSSQPTTSSTSSTTHTTSHTDPSTETTSHTSNTTSSATSTGSSSTSSTPPSTTTSSGNTSSTTPSAGVLGASTGTPSTGADVEFGLGVALALGGGGLMIVASRFGRRKRN